MAKDFFKKFRGRIMAPILFYETHEHQGWSVTVGTIKRRGREMGETRVGGRRLN